MAAPTYVAVSAGVTDAGGVWAFGPSGNPGIGNIVIFQILQDGATAGAVTVTTFTSAIEALDGTDSSMTYIGEFAVGSATAAYQKLWIG